MAGNAVIGALRVSLGLDSAEFEDGLKSAQASLGKFGKTAGVAVAAAVTAATAAVTALGYAVKGVIDYADDMDKAAQKFGVPIEDLTRLKYAAEMSNVAFESLGTGLRKLAQNMDTAATEGTGKASDAFKRLGIEVETADGHLRSQTEVMGDLAEKFATMPDGAQKTAAAMAIFGKSGADLIPILNEGRDGLKALTDEADAFGLTISGKTAAEADAFNDNLDRMGKIWDGLVIKLTSKLLPYLEKLSVILLNFAKDGPKVEAVFEGITNALKWVVEAVYLATVRMERLGLTLTAFWNAASSPFDRSGWDQLGAVIDENKARMASAREELKALWDTSTNGLGKDFGSGWTAGNDNAAGPGAYAGGTEEEERAAAKATRDQERLDAQLERLRASLMTEDELIVANYQKQLADLQEFENQKALTTEEGAALRAQIESDYADKLAVIREQQLNDFASTIGSAGSIIESLTKIMGKEGDKQLGIVKALSLAEGLINVYTGITAALRLPFPANLAAAATVAAQGFATLASMRSVSKGSSGGGHSAGGGGGASSAAAPAASAGPNAGQSMHVTFKGKFDGEGVEAIAKKLNDYVRDGGTVLYSKAA